MVETLKKILIEPLEREKQEKGEVINSFKNKINDLASQMNGQLDKKISIEQDLNNMNRGLKKFFYSKKIEQLKNQLDNINKKYEENDNLILNNKLNIKELEDNIREITSRIELINSASSIGELGYNFEQVVNLFNDNNIDMYFDENDLKLYKNIDNSEKELKSLDDLVLIHKTMYIPENNMIKTGFEKGVVKEENFNINGINLKKSIKINRNTLHFCLNGEVSGNFIGANDWDNCKYAVVIPFNSIPRDKYANVYTVDTYTYGGVTLDNSCYILCPKEEYKIIKQSNPNVNIVKYSGSNVTGYADMLITLLGYKKEEAKNLYWRNQEDNSKVYNIVAQANLPQKGNHMETIDKYKEDCYDGINAVVATFKAIQDNIEINNIEEIASIYDQLLKSYTFLGYFHDIIRGYGDVGFLGDEKVINDLFVSLDKYKVNYNHDLYRLLLSISAEVKADKDYVSENRSEVVSNLVKLLPLELSNNASVKNIINSEIKNIQFRLGDFIETIFAVTTLYEFYNRQKENRNIINIDEEMERKRH